MQDVVHILRGQELTKLTPVRMWCGEADVSSLLPPRQQGTVHELHPAVRSRMVGSASGPLGTAAVGQWSAGCQLICGMASWTEFIRLAWTEEGNAVSYFLVDVRDIPSSAFDVR